MMRGYDWNGWGMMGGGVAWIITMLFWFVVAMAIVLFIVWVVRMSTHHPGGDRQHEQRYGPGGYGQREWEQRPQTPVPPAAGPVEPGAPRSGMEDDAVAIARRRFASGEITRAEYDEILDALGR